MSSVRSSNKQPRTRRNRGRGVRRGLVASNMVVDKLSYIQPANSIYRVRLAFEFSLTTSGTGNINLAVPVNPSSSTEFSALVGIYDEYRVTGGELSLVYTSPLITSGSSQANGLVYCAYDFNDITTPMGAADVFNHGTRTAFRAISLDRVPFKYNFLYPRSGGATAILWTPTTSPVPYGSVKFSASGLTASTQYFAGLMDIYVQFRGRL